MSERLDQTKLLEPPDGSRVGTDYGFVCDPHVDFLAAVPRLALATWVAQDGGHLHRVDGAVGASAIPMVLGGRVMKERLEAVRRFLDGASLWPVVAIGVEAGGERRRMSATDAAVRGKKWYGKDAAERMFTAPRPDRQVHRHVRVSGWFLGMLLDVAS